MAEIEVWRGGVAAWECDAMGHLNVGFYVAKSMEALVGLAAALGMPQAFGPHADATLIVADQHIRFLKEAHPGAALTMTGGVLEMGETTARLLMVMRHADGAPAASFQTVVRHATARDGGDFPWPQRLRDAAEALKVPEPGADVGPRSLGVDPVETTASAERAEALGLARTGTGAVRQVDCDAFGRMRTEQFMARISDGITHLIGPQRPGGGEGRRIGGAALEYRLLHFAWPRSGDRVELRSGMSGGDARLRRFVHWLLDPATGRPFASAEAVAVSFDLDTRKMITLTDAELAVLQTKVVEGLAL